MDTIGKRIAFIRGSEARKDFAAKLNVPVSTLRNYESDISLPNSDFIARFCAECGVNLYWLIYGEKDGIEYSIDAGAGLEPTARLPEQMVKVGRFDKISSQFNLFTSRTSHMLSNAIKRNMAFYTRICLLYRESEKYEGYDVSIIAEGKEDCFDLYMCQSLNSSSDFFLVEILGILFSACRMHVSLHENYTTNKDLEDMIQQFKKQTYEFPPTILAHVMFGEPVDVPQFFYGFYEVDPPKKD